MTAHPVSATVRTSDGAGEVTFDVSAILANYAPDALARLRADGWTGAVASDLRFGLSNYQHVPGITLELDQRLGLLADYVRVNNAVRDAGLSVSVQVDVAQAEAWFASLFGSTDETTPSKPRRSNKPLVVFGTRVIARPDWPTTVDQPRIVVAVTSRAAAARALAAAYTGITDDHMKSYGAPTFDPTEVDAAMSAPGTVFVETSDPSTYVPLAPTEQP